jgi:hypothetical protein
MRIRALLMIAALAAPACFAADYDAKAAFERMKTLAGEWEGKLGADTGKVTYEVISGGSAILERFSSTALGPGGNMISIYHLDGKRLMMTHYCMAQNQPRLVAKSYDAAKGELAFEFLDVTNLAPGGTHISSAVFRFGDGKHFAAVWGATKDGKPEPAETFNYTRVK